MTTLQLKFGDCVERIAELPDGSVGAVVSDPPYGLRFMGKEFDDLGDGSAQREWHRAWVNQAFRVIRPGGVIKAFCGTRTFHHLAAVIREAGFTDIRIEAWKWLVHGFLRSGMRTIANPRMVAICGASLRRRKFP